MTSRLASVVVAFFSALPLSSAAAVSTKKDDTASSRLAGGPQAIVIGVSQYASQAAGLRYASRDATEVAETLTGRGYKVNVLVDRTATKTSILRTLEQVVGALGENDTFVLYFAGHGSSDSIGAVLFPSDADPARADTGLAWTQLLRILEGSRARHVLVMLDACRIGTGLSPFRLDGEPSTNRVQVLYSTSSNGTSYEYDDLRHGVFTHFLLEGMRGAAAGDDGTITVRALAHYVADSVRTYSLSKGNLQVPYLTSASDPEIVLFSPKVPRVISPRSPTPRPARHPAPPSLSASCTLNPNTITLGQSATLNVTASGGIAPYTYTWSGTSSGTGSYTVTLHAGDVVGSTASGIQQHLHLEVHAPRITTISPTRVASGSSFNMTLYGSGFNDGWRATVATSDAVWLFVRKPEQPRWTTTMPGGSPGGTFSPRYVEILTRHLTEALEDIHANLQPSERALPSEMFLSTGALGTMGRWEATAGDSFHSLLLPGQWSVSADDGFMNELMRADVTAMALYQAALQTSGETPRDGPVPTASSGPTVEISFPFGTIQLGASDVRTVSSGRIEAQVTPSKECTPYTVRIIAGVSNTVPLASRRRAVPQPRPPSSGDTIAAVQMLDLGVTTDDPRFFATLCTTYPNSKQCEMANWLMAKRSQAGYARGLDGKPSPAEKSSEETIVHLRLTTLLQCCVAALAAFVAAIAGYHQLFLKTALEKNGSHRPLVTLK